MNNVNIIDLLNLADGEAFYKKAGFVISKKAPDNAIRDAVIEALEDLDIYDEEQTENYKDTAATSNFYTEDQLDAVIDLIKDFGSKTSDQEKTIWFE